MESIIFVMSLMGSVMLVLYLVLQPIASRYFSAKWKYAILKICMVLLVIPLPELKNYLLRLVDTNDGNITNLNDSLIKMHLEQAIEVHSGELQTLPVKFSFLVILTVVWFIGFAIILCGLIYSYFKIKNYMINNSEVVADAYVLEMLEDLKSELGIKKKVLTLVSPNINSPVTMGLFSSKVILPDIKFEEEKLKYILAHELIHIKHGDFLIRLFAVFIMALHWFNPFSYMLLKEIGTICEYACDESVVLNLNVQQRKMYGHTILDMSAKNILCSGPGKILINSFSNENEKAMKERLTNVKRIKKTKAGTRILSVVMGLAMTMMSMMTVFAYNEPKLIEGESKAVASSETVKNATATFGKRNSQSLIQDSNTRSIRVVEFFVDSKGETHVLTGNVLNDDRALCIHKYEEGEYIRHTLYTNGGCMEEYYDAKMCAYCNRIVLGTKTNTIKYAVCVH